MCQQTISEVVEDWFRQSSREDGNPALCDIVHDDLEVAWPAILEILQRASTEDQVAVLAAGPLEDLLAFHGPEFIDRVECEAARNPRFRQLLGGVWQNRILLEIWERVQKVRREVW